MNHIWEHAGQKFQYLSFYSLPEDAWHHELSGLGTQAYACVVIPDTTPDDGPFTPGPPEDVTLVLRDGIIPWPIWVAFLSALRSSGDLTSGFPTDG